MNNNLEDTIILKNANRKIFKNKELENLIQFKLDKTIFEEEDLAEIKEITFNGKKLNGDINIVDFNELDFFQNLNKIELKNLEISKQHMKKLEKLDEIHFKNCKIESIQEIKNIKKLSINNCILESFSQIGEFKNLEELEIINVKIEDWNFLIDLKNLQVLKLKNIEKFSLDKINFVLNIKYLSVQEINELDEGEILKNYPKLETLSIDFQKQEEWSEKLEMLMKNGINILLNDIYDY